MSPGGFQNVVVVVVIIIIIIKLFCIVLWSLYGIPELSMLQTLIKWKRVTGLSRGK